MIKEIGTIKYNEETGRVMFDVDAKVLIEKFGPMILSKIDLSKLIFGKK